MDVKMSKMVQLLQETTPTSSSEIQYDNKVDKMCNIHSVPSFTVVANDSVSFTNEYGRN
jgi:hypothetical protein